VWIIAQTCSAQRETVKGECRKSHEHVAAKSIPCRKIFQTP